jgi:hypothetical protein
MAGTITRGNIPRLLQEGLNTTFGHEYKRYPDQFTKLFNTESSRKAFEIDQMVEGMGLASIKPEGSDVAFDDFQQGYAPKYNHYTVAKGFVVTQEALEDEQYGLMSKKARMLGYSMKITKEVIAANIYNRAFNPAFTMPDGDGVQLLSASHPAGPSGGTFSNVLSVAADLSEASLEDLLIQIGLATDSRGQRMMLSAEKLIVPVALQFDAHRILKSTLQNDTANNAINAVRSMGLISEVVVNNYLTSNDAWFIKTDVPDGMKHFVRRAIAFGEDNAFLSGNARFKASERYSFGWSDPRGVYGSAGTA